MSDQSSFEKTSSVGTSSSGATKNTCSMGTSSSSNTMRPGRPTYARDHSYTHVFPAEPTAPNPRKSTTRIANPPRVGTPMGVQDENTRLLLGGLHWLLDASIQTKESTQKLEAVHASSEPLSEKAVASFNAQRNGSNVSSSEPAHTAAWIDGQIKTPAAPPF